MDEEKQINEKDANITEKDSIDQGNEIINTLKKQSEDYLKGWQIERANLLNYQKDEPARLSSAININERELIKEILTVVDSFDLVLKHIDSKENDQYKKGITIIYDQLIALLNRHQCFPYDSIGQVFDPNIHDAVEMIKDELKENNTIIEEAQKGYRYKDNVLRPAKVKVIINN